MSREVKLAERLDVGGEVLDYLERGIWYGKGKGGGGGKKFGEFEKERVRARPERKGGAT